MIKCISFALVLLTVGCNKPKESNQNGIAVIDTTFTKYVTLTIDGDSAEINYHIQVADWSQPVNWTMQVISNGKTILSYSSLDSAIDDFFRDTTYLFGCSNYIDCKKKWYLDRITRCNIDTIKVNDDRRVNLAHDSNEAIKV
jgi:hypothetical protein